MYFIIICLICSVLQNNVVLPIIKVMKKKRKKKIIHPKIQQLFFLLFINIFTLVASVYIVFIAVKSQPYYFLLIILG